MAEKKPLRIGLVGYGFMGRTHSNAFRKAPNFFDLEHEPVLAAVCARNRTRARKFAKQWGWESVVTDWRKLVERDDIDVIDIASPNDTHHDIAIAAAEAGKAILCEKPLSLTGKEGEAMVKAVEKAKVPNMVWYNYRRVPAVALAKDMIDEGRVGKVYHYRANFLQDWTISEDLPQGGEGLWRLDAKVAGSGVTGDLLAHCIDTAIWLNGPITEVSAMTETFVKKRKHTITGKMQKVNIDDACAFLAKFRNGSLAIFESTRYARGHKALYTFEINGADGSLAWDLHDLHRLDYFDYDKEDSKTRGWRSIHVSDNGGEHPYMDKWWVPGLNIGYEHTFVNQFADFVQSLESRKKRPDNRRPDFRDALETQYICETVLDSAKTGRWKKVPKFKG